jgi:hypothetical protein
MDFRIIITDEDGTTDALTLGQFAMLNADDRDLVNAVRNIGIGETLALGGLVGAFGCMVVLVHAIVNNTRGARDTVKQAIAKSEGLDRADRAMQAMLDELKAKKVQP